MTVAEVLAISTFIFSVLCHLTQKLALFSTSAVFLFQFFLDIFYTSKNTCSCESLFATPHSAPRNYGPGTAAESQNLRGRREGQQREEEGEEGEDNSHGNTPKKMIMRVLSDLFQNRVTKTVAFLLQILGILGLAGVIGLEFQKTSEPEVYLEPVIGLPLSIIVLSIVWSNKIQEYIAAPGKASWNRPYIKYNARYKASKCIIILYCTDVEKGYDII